MAPPDFQTAEAPHEIENDLVRSSIRHRADTRDREPANGFDYLLREPRGGRRLRRMSITAGIAGLVAMGALLYVCA
jgi:hypothetical protein